MSETKYTPGPWSLATGSIPGSLKDHAIVGPPVSLIIANVVSSKESKANARLISAAPEMAEALLQIAKAEITYEGGGKTAPAWADKTIAALQKAGLL